MANVSKPQVVVPPSATQGFTKQKNLMVLDIDRVIVHSLPWEDVPSLTWFVENSSKQTYIISPAKHHPLRSIIRFSNSCTWFRIRKITTIKDVLHAPNPIIYRYCNKPETISLLAIEACSSSHAISKLHSKHFTNISSSDAQSTINIARQENCQVSKIYYAFASKCRMYFSIIRKDFFEMLASVYGEYNVVLYTRGSRRYANFIYNGLFATHRHIYSNATNKTMRFNVDCVISDSRKVNPGAKKTLEALETLPEVAHQFSPLHDYHSVIILDDDANTVWSHGKIYQMYYIHKIPVFLIHVPRFCAWAQDDLSMVNGVKITEMTIAGPYSLFLLGRLFKYFDQETFFKDFSRFLKIYHSLSAWKKIVMCTDPGIISEFITNTSKWLFAAGNCGDQIGWWKIETHQDARR